MSDLLERWTPIDGFPGYTVSDGFAPSLVRFIDDLARKNSEALSFIPRPRLEQYVSRGQVLFAYENDEPAGFLVYGRGWPQTRIYQACIQYDARRQQLGLDLVARLVETSEAARCSDIRLWCADDLDASRFWSAAGFRPCATRAGGARRGRTHTLWARRLLTPDLFGGSEATIHGLDEASVRPTKGLAA